MKNKKSENDKRIIAISILVIVLFTGILIGSLVWLVREVGEVTNIPEVTATSDKFNLSQAAELSIGGAKPTTAPVPAEALPETKEAQPAGSGSSPVKSAI